MEIVKDWPPNISEIRKVFDLREFTPIFAYGDKIYNPTGGDISPDLIVHEEVHQKQQKKTGAAVWWQLYLIDPNFRLKQEIEAYQEQYKFISKYMAREYRREYLKIFARQLSSKMYGNIITKEKAKELINV